MRNAHLTAIAVLALFMASPHVYAQQAAAPSATVTAPSAAAKAPDPAALAAATELIKVAKTDENFKQIFPSMARAMTDILIRNNPQKADLINSLIAQYYVPEFSAHIGELDQQMAIIYAQNFTADDLRQLVAFYKSPVGQKYVTTMPQTMTQFMPVAKAWAQQVAHGASLKLMDQLQKNNIQVPKGPQ